MKLQPKGDRLLIEVIEEKEIETPNAKLKLILPEEKETYGMPNKGKIMAVGDGENCKRMSFLKGDIVYFSKYAGQPMKISSRTFEDLDRDKFDDMKDYLFLSTRDIYGRVK